MPRSFEQVRVMTDADKVAFADWVSEPSNPPLAPFHAWAARATEPPLGAERVVATVAYDRSLPTGYLVGYLDLHVGHAWRFMAAERVIGFMERVASGQIADRPELEPAFEWIAANAARDRPSLGD